MSKYIIMVFEIVQDAFFAAIAAIGFAAISRPPRRAYLFCALLAAVGHSLRYVLMLPGLLETHIVVATTLAAFVVGLLAVLVSPVARVPAETCLYPSLLPMIPGVYAYKTFGGLAMCVFGKEQELYDFYFYQFTYNGIMCVFIIFGMVIGATLPIFMLKRISFQATR